MLYFRTSQVVVLLHRSSNMVPLEDSRAAAPGSPRHSIQSRGTMGSRPGEDILSRGKGDFYSAQRRFPQIPPDVAFFSFPVSWRGWMWRKFPDAACRGKKSSRFPPKNFSIPHSRIPSSSRSPKTRPREHVNKTYRSSAVGGAHLYVRSVDFWKSMKKTSGREKL